LSDVDEEDTYRRVDVDEEEEVVVVVSSGPFLLLSFLVLLHRRIEDWGVNDFTKNGAVVVVATTIINKQTYRLGVMLCDEGPSGVF